MMKCRMPRGWGSAAGWVVLALGILFGHSASAAVTTVNVSNVSQLVNALSTANGAGGSYVIALADGTYTVSSTLHVTGPNITITSQSGVRENVIIEGDAMSANAAVGDVILVSASNFTLSNVTLQHCGWDLLQIAGEDNAQNALVHNVVFRDGYQQLLKVSVLQSTPGTATPGATTANNGIIEDSLFEYTAGVGPEYYIGGIDIHAGKNWIVRGNTFNSIISPNTAVAEFAIHVWDSSANALVEKNLIINCDRGIGFGLGTAANTGGIIRNNMIYHAANNGQFADVSIDLEESPGSQVYNNTVLAMHSYPNAIEYRFTQTTGALIVNNLTNKAIEARDGATGTVATNVTDAVSSWFVNPTQGDLHLAYKVPGVVGAGQPVSGLTDDFDGDPRPANSIDIGADQFGGGAAGTAAIPNPPTNVTVH